MPVSHNTGKRCGRCRKLKPFDQFGMVKGKIRNCCRECHNAEIYTPDLRTEKWCPSCQETKLVGDFNRLGVRYQSTCRNCQNARLSVRRAEEKDAGLSVEINRRNYIQRRKWVTLKSKYGITREEYLQRIEEQGNLCAICRKPETETSSPHTDEMDLSVDHCHKTGQVRGLLCRQCNIALGKFKEDISILESAIAYLKKYA